MPIQPEFQAVVLAAGRGSRMLEITSGQPKCLLPVGPKPLVWYTLSKLQSSGFNDAILIVLESQKAEIESAISKEIESGALDITIDYVSINEDKDLGTADSLRVREVQEKLKSDVLVVSCDLVTDINLNGVLNLFRKHNASVATLMFEGGDGGGPVPGPKSKHKPEKDLIGIDQQTDRLILIASASDYDTDIQLSRTFLKKHTHFQMYSTLLDSHVYVLKHWVLEFLRNEDTFTSLKGELIPFIVKKQMSRVRKAAESSGEVPEESRPDIFSYAKEDPLECLIRDMSAYNDHTGDLKPVYHGDLIRCYAYVAPKGCVGVRVNTLQAYWNINGQIQEIWSKLSGNQPLVRTSPTADIQSNQVDDKCVIWDGAKLKEKTSFKNAIIGTNSTVHSFSRIFNSIVMQNVVIKEKVALENCIVCDSAVIEGGSKLKNCIVGNSHLVPEGSEHTNELLTEVLMHF